VRRSAGVQLAAPGIGYCAGAAGSGYPPGNQLLIAGARFNATIVRYLEFARDFKEKFPGFETDIHGLVKDGSCGAACYYDDCVAK
jgi:arginine decarboxylase